MLFEQANRQHKPINGTFELTSNCNFNCKMCYVHGCRMKSENASAADWKRVIDSAYEAGLMYALITGGEPLLHSGFTGIYEHLYKKGVVSVLNTNGYLLDDLYISFLKKLPPSRINLTLYGADDETYKNLCGVSQGFTQVEKNIIKLKESGFNLNLNMTFVKSNVHQIKEMVYFAQKYKLPFRPTTYVFSSSLNGAEERLPAETAAQKALEIYRLSHTDDEFKKLAYDTYSRFTAGQKNKADRLSDGTTCRAGKSSYWIHSDGRLSFCGMADSKNEKNVFSLGFKEAWDQAAADASSVRNYALCSACEYRFICKRCFAMLNTENINENNLENSYTCSYYKCYTSELVKIHLKG